MKQIIILGSTGSIGTQALDIVLRHPDRFQVVGLAAGSNLEILKKQIETFQPKMVSVARKEDAESLKNIFPQNGFEVVWGETGACHLVEALDADFVISAIVGAAGLKPTLKALETKKTVGLANKESLVIAGELMTRKAKENGVSLIPIDSEHSAIFQALQGNRLQDVKRLLLTASGGPFFDRPMESFQNITVEEALNHPKWKMGPKITIDSATLMNKGLEVMEAAWLFDMPSNKVDIVIHPQSIVHSLVEYIDGSVMAQLGVPDMRCAISYAMAYPERVTSGVESLDLFKVGTLTFHETDTKKFPCIRLAYEAVKAGGTMPAVLNAANEVAVAKFLDRKVAFRDIPQIIERTMQQHQPAPLTSLDSLIEADRWARERAT